MDTTAPAADCDVLVVGAGPTGLTAACELARRGVSVRVVDRAAPPSAARAGRVRNHARWKSWTTSEWRGA
ncbi:FAD-dependent oxidoreductase [Streptomyces rugosispiralis]|uniref:FAD-dependent oxidoreductase n=1 Tax=Streptomyces rugosispiralis TaxID=2967341 RepID=A0ABT1VDD7_9ACTN|nr:FAD-dependent oxidoreductase [Streptomyces rugosispiralis]MCQ8194759.1 FAD-dependent oxidoreductase [Streptomyces rugosispiralis]